MERVIIKLDKQMMVEELYKIRALFSDKPEAAEDALLKLITLVSNAPVETGKAQWAKISGRSG